MKFTKYEIVTWAILIIMTAGSLAMFTYNQGLQEGLEVSREQTSNTISALHLSAEYQDQLLKCIDKTYQVRQSP